ncbi:sulfur reduction protein DsrE [Muricauda sp. 334s03]|uniref:Sulfur reduction protein DsrE n=1 Tax=Flagellimonas yonaguniensis TaxID=3031325 RepID=A0ABT5XYN6_9FLAO|nr:sulfur reduction protein DsrE [[Muricauda] yonaguniensis]MDF0716303.1 sulfur reduction protein DsrE [[Muricauda] yonaguniensis]
MKNIITLAIMAITLFGGITEVSAQSTYLKDKNNYFVLTRKIPQLKAILLAADELGTKDGSKFGEFHVVICGETVKELTNLETMQPFLDLAQSEKIKLLACGFSLKKFGVDANQLPKQMDVVANGILYGFNLQKDGFLSITL